MEPNTHKYQTLKEVKRRLFRTKSPNSFQVDVEGQAFKRRLTAFDLSVIGIGAIIGTGIFVLTGTAAALYAGPAVVISFLIAGLAAALAALCYSEMASMLPVSGSAYTYTYATMGELAAWIIGWDLILEYVVGAATVAVGWSGYIVNFFITCGVPVDPRWVGPPIDFDPVTDTFKSSGSYINIPAIVSVMTATTILLFGIRRTAMLNSIAVAIKLAVIILFIGVSIPHVNPDNWKPFVPPSTGEFGKFGVSGIFQAATLVFFSYIGFDAISTTAQECKDPQRDIPIGILSSLVVCTLLYVIVSLLLTGLVPYQQLDLPHPVSYAVQFVGIKFMTIIIELGAVAGLSSVLLVQLLGQPRIFFSMASDGLLPPMFAKLHPRFRTPWTTTILSGSVCAILAGIFPIDILGELTSVGTLFAFLLVSLGVLILRKRRPDLPRLFKVPGGPYLIPVSSAIVSFILICSASPRTILRLFVWMGIGLVIYGTYGYKHSLLRQKIESIADSRESLGNTQKYIQMDNF